MQVFGMGACLGGRSFFDALSEAFVVWNKLPEFFEST